MMPTDEPLHLFPDTIGGWLAYIGIVILGCAGWAACFVIAETLSAVFGP